MYIYTYLHEYLSLSVYLCLFLSIYTISFLNSYPNTRVSVFFHTYTYVYGCMRTKISYLNKMCKILKDDLMFTSFPFLSIHSCIQKGPGTSFTIP